MGFGNKEILAGRVLDGNDYLNKIDPDKIQELEAEITDLIYQRTDIVPPEDPAEAPAILRGIWGDIALFKSSKWQKNISEEELKRRTALKNDAYDLLYQIESGKIVVKKDGENVIVKTEESCPVQISGTSRIKTI